ncbi:MAG TPA: IDEAL domain-containing protein [Bacillales bacterium]|nr:IDEAL domain-containing protein [Bacillales bacterium]
MEHFQREKLMTLIDIALDQHDRDAFEALTEKLRKINNQ